MLQAIEQGNDTGRLTMDLEYLSCRSRDRQVVASIRGYDQQVLIIGRNYSQQGK